MFLREFSARVEQVEVWASRDTGYQPLPYDHPVLGRRLKDKETLSCWVCGSKDLTYTKVMEGEQ